MDHYPFCKGYFIDYGVIYLPDEEKLLFWGWCDWSASFLLTEASEDDLTKYHIEDMDITDLLYRENFCKN